MPTPKVKVSARRISHERYDVIQRLLRLVESDESIAARLIVIDMELPEHILAHAEGRHPPLIPAGILARWALGYEIPGAKEKP